MPSPQQRVSAYLRLPLRSLDEAQREIAEERRLWRLCEGRRPDAGTRGDTGAPDRGAAAPCPGGAIVAGGDVRRE